MCRQTYLKWIKSAADIYSENKDILSTCHNSKSNKEHQPVGHLQHEFKINFNAISAVNTFSKVLHYVDSETEKDISPKRDWVTTLQPEDVSTKIKVKYKEYDTSSDPENKCSVYSEETMTM